jgi:hypothetical protein
MSTPADRERRQYPRFSCADPIRISLTNLSEHTITGECLEVCCNGLRIQTEQVIPAPIEVSLRALSLGLSGKGIVHYCHGEERKYIVGLEFTGGLIWKPPEPAAVESTLSAAMTPRAAAIFEDLLGGASARELQSAVEQLSDEERDILFCTAACIQSAVAETCRDRAAEITGLLNANSQRLPATLVSI